MLKVIYHRKFIKDLKKISKDYSALIQDYVFETLPNYSDFSQITKIIKLRGSVNYYRIRIGDYRIGLRFENDTLYVERVLHRSKIYKEYP